MLLKTHVILHILNFTLLTDLLTYFINLQLASRKNNMDTKLKNYYI